MSITSRLFQKAVKVLRGSKKRTSTAQAPAAADTFAQRISFEPMEQRLLMSTVTIESISDTAEGGVDGVFRITRDDTLGDLTVKFARKGTASFGAAKDYLLNDGVNALTTSVVIPDGLAFIDINVTSVDDTKAEPTETIILNLSSGTGYDLSPDFSLRTATVDLADNEPILSIVATDSVASETAGNPGTFTITRAGNTTGDLTVRFQLTGTARRGTDYLITSGGNPVTTSVVIPDGQASVDITIDVIDDARYEPTENINIKLLTSSLYTLGVVSTGSVVVNDDEPLVFVDPAATAPASFTIDTNNEFGADTFIMTGLESNETHDAGPTFIEFARDGLLLVNQNRPLEVRNAQGVNEAESRKAYVSFDMSLFPFATFSNAFFTLTLVDFSGDSPNNTNFKFNVYGIKDDFVPSANEQNEDWNEDIDYGDAPGNVSDGGSVDESDMFGGGPLGSFNIVGTGTVGQKVSIGGQLLTDFLNNESTLDADGDSLVTFVIVRENVGADNDDVVHMFGSRDDPFGEADTSVIPQLTAFGDLVGQTVNEGDITTIRVFRAGNTVGDITVPFNASGVARLGIDYRLEVNGTPVLNSFVIPDGAAFADISVLTIDDGTYEIDESFTITLGSNNSFVLDSVNKSVELSLVDNEPVVTIEATDPDAQEPDITTPSLDTGFWTLTRTGSTAEELIVTVKYSGTALNGNDYEPINKEIVFLPGEASIIVVLDPNADFIPEGREEATMTLVPKSHYGLSWVLRGSRTSTGSSLGPRIISAGNIQQARQVAKNLGFAGPSLNPNDQSDTIDILNGTPAPGPDLIAAFFTLNNLIVDNDTAGGAFGTFTVKNQGTVATGAFNVLFILSADRDFTDPGDLTLQIQAIQGLGAGQSITISVAFGDLSTMAAGKYQIGAFVDSDDFILETIEDNNGTGTDDAPITLTD